MDMPVLANQQRLTGCKLEDLPEMMDDRNGWQERVRELHAVNTT